MIYTHDDYTVGWIAALSDELTSAQALLDDEHDTLAAVRGDYNAYTLGRIGSHNISIAGLPEGVIGTNAAGHAAANLFRSFPNVRFALMVGVGGGVPSGNIRLGDVVVSVPQGQMGGVIQYDLGTNLQEEGFVRKGFLRDPPAEVLTAVKKLRATARRKGYKLNIYHDEMLKDNPLLKPAFERPEKDNLYESDYVHIGTKADCSKCDASKLVQRDNRDTTMVHYGIIGSGNQEGIICFEMEAAGLMSNLECIIIRGICDYCDTHKNKHWQPYAGAVAAAYAKELLLTIPPHRVEEMPKSRVLGSIHEEVRKLVIHTEKTYRSQEFHEAVEWLAASEPEENYRSALKLREPGTGSWLVESAVYAQWKTDSIRHLWLYGKAGCGKSVIAATIIEDIRSYCNDRTNIGCAMFYFTFSDAKKQSYQDCLCSLVRQIAMSDPASTLLLRAHQESKSGMGRCLPKEESLRQILISTIQSYDQFILILDALDESPDTIEGNHTTRQMLLEWLRTLSSQVPKLKILATSRHLNDIQDEMGMLNARSVSMITEFVNKDIKKYVNSHLSSDPRLSRLKPSMKKRVEEVFMKKADGMFRWAYCQMRELKLLRSTKASHVEKVLLDLPRTLDETYNRMIERIPPELHTDAFSLLRWLAYSQRPMKLSELSEAIVIDPYCGDGVVNIDDRGCPEDVLEILSGFIVFVESAETIPGEQESDTVSYESDSVFHASDSESYQSDTDFEEDNVIYGGRMSSSGSYTNRSIRLAHFSLQEYLESTRILESNVRTFHLQRTRDQQFLSHCCVIYLMDYAANSKMTKTTDDLGVFPLLGYAARFWYEHCQDIEDVSLQVRFLRSESSVGCWVLVHSPDMSWVDPFGIQNFAQPPGSALYYAAVTNLLSVGKVLIEDHKADVNAQSGMYGNALQAASCQGHENIVRMLIEEYKVDVNAQGGHHSTALQAASYRRHEEIARVLIENKADVNAQGGYYGNALQAALAGDSERIARMLIEEHKVNVNAQGGQFGNALQAASRIGYKEIVRMLIENKADVNAQGGYYGNPLQAASYRGHEEIVRMLIENKADVNAQGGYYGNALYAASYGEHENIVKILVENGAVREVDWEEITSCSDHYGVI